MDDNTMKSTLTQERQKLHEMQDSAWEIRQRHKKDIEERAASEKNKEVELIVRVQRHREIQKRTFERIGYTLKGIIVCATYKTWTTKTLIPCIHGGHFGIHSKIHR